METASPDQYRYSRWITELLSLLQLPAAVLDLGCGNGLPAAKLLADAGCDVTGVDLSPVQVERARALVSGARFVCADMTAVDFQSGRFAAVVSLYAIIHVPVAEQRRLFASIYRCLEPGGLFLATVGADAWTGTEADWLGVPGALMYWSHADAETYAQWLAEAGFQVRWTRFVPEGQSGHTLVLAQRPG